MTNTFRAALAVAALAVAAPVASQAATVTVGPMPTESKLNPDLIANGVVYHNMVGTRPGEAADPWAGTANEGIGYYTAVLANSSATFTEGLGKAISFIWGSPDAYNSVDFLNGGSVVDTATFTGPTSLVTVSNIAGGIFDAVRFVSGGNSFEFAVLDLDAPEPDVAPVPVPAAGVMLLTAFGGVAALRRRKSA